MSHAEFQKIYIRPETVPGDTVLSFADGVQVRTVGLVELGSIKEELVDPGVVKTDADDAGISPVLGLAQGEISLVTQISGITRDGGAVDPDNDSVYLEMVVGTADSTANDECVAGSTTTVIAATAHPYDAGDLVMINGQVRRVESDDGADQFTLSMPLSAAPLTGTTIYGVQWYDSLVPSAETVGVGISQVDSELQFALSKCAVTGIELNALDPGTLGQLTAKIAVGGIARDTLTPATDECGLRGVVTGKAGGGLRIKSATGTLLSPSAASVQINMGVVREWETDYGSDEGKAGTITGPAESTIECTLHQDSTFSAFSAIAALKPSATAAAVATEIVCQVGSSPGAVWGVYFPEAYLVDGPVPEKIGIAQGVKCTFRSSRGLLFRA